MTAGNDQADSDEYEIVSTKTLNWSDEQEQKRATSTDWAETYTTLTNFSFFLISGLFFIAGGFLITICPNDPI